MFLFALVSRLFGASFSCCKSAYAAGCDLLRFSSFPKKGLFHGGGSVVDKVWLRYSDGNRRVSAKDPKEPRWSTVNGKR